MSQGDIGRQWESESGITPAEVEAFASNLEIAAGKLKEVAPQCASAEDSDRMRARDALMIIDKFLADELVAFSKKVEK
jgi:hypothetical protein